MNKPTIRPGQLCPQSGQYKPVGPRGGNVSSGEVTAVEGNRMPPTEKPGQRFVLVDPTRHKR